MEETKQTIETKSRRSVRDWVLSVGMVTTWL